VPFYFRSRLEEPARAATDRRSETARRLFRRFVRCSKKMPSILAKPLQSRHQYRRFITESRFFSAPAPSLCAAA